MTTPATINCHWTVRPYRKAIPDSTGQKDETEAG
jgi:hypothetical protein